ncbi:MAG: LysM peptidoglycan-binding domain-containing protein [Chloroflexi bacterium]|nr:LysM peptidoglycan-binding domain-containing protein [Chloroflexota bacterium]
MAQRYGLSWEALWEANKASLPRPEDLRVGQKLLIPRPSP